MHVCDWKPKVIQQDVGIHTVDGYIKQWGPAVQYYVLTQNPRLSEVFDWLKAHSIAIDIHLNRTRFTIEEG
jgi:hypothetical protein